MKLLVARHGQTQANAEHRYQGALDLPLNAVGIRQARDIASHIEEAVDAIYVSPLLRAQQTANAVSSILGMPTCIAPAFRERHVGVFEGLTQAQAQMQFPDLWARNITRQWHAAPDGGETIGAVADRVANGLRALAHQHPHATVLLIAHGFVAKVVRALATNDTSDFFGWQLANGSVLALDFAPNWIPPELREPPSTGAH